MEKQTVGKLLERWLELIRAKQSSKTYKQQCSTARILEGLYKTPVKQLTTLGILDALKAVPTTEGQRYRALQVLAQFLDWCCMLELIETNKARILLKNSKLHDVVKPAIKGFAYVDYTELKSVVLDRLSTVSAAQQVIYLYIILTCARLNEALSLRWEYIDFEAGTITLPPEVMKCRRPHTIFMSPQLRGLLRHWQTQHAGGRCVFGSPRNRDLPRNPHPLSTGMHKLSGGKTTVHGLRKTARTWFAASHCNPHVAELLLSHASTETGTDIEAVYNKYDYRKEKTDLLKRWDMYVQLSLPLELQPLLGNAQERA